MNLKVNDYFLVDEEFWGVMQITSIHTCNPKYSEDSPWFYKGFLYKAKKISRTGVQKSRAFYDEWEDFDGCIKITPEENPEYFL